MRRHSPVVVVWVVVSVVPKNNNTSLRVAIIEGGFLLDKMASLHFDLGWNISNIVNSLLYEYAFTFTLMSQCTFVETAIYNSGILH